MISNPTTVGLPLAASLILLLLTSCGKPLEETKAHMPVPGGDTLELAFNDLLDEPLWELTQVREADPDKGKMVRVQYVTIAGKLKGTTADFKAWYRVNRKAPPEMTRLSVKGKDRQPDEFDRILSEYYLARVIQMQ